MTHPFTALEVACRARPPIAALVLGSGLNDVTEAWPLLHAVPFAELPGMPKATVAGHKGRLCLHEFAGRNVLVFQGRVHFYEGHPWSVVERPVHIAHKLGAHILILTNASGGINPAIEPGSLMAIRDHIPATRPNWWQSFVKTETQATAEFIREDSEFHNLEYVDLEGVTVPQSLIEMVPEAVARENCVLPLLVTGRVLKIVTSEPDSYDVLQKIQFILDKDIQPVLAVREQIVAAIDRHYRQSNLPYCPVLLRVLRRAAVDIGIELPEGVYACVTGPNYETPAEVRAFQKLGADAVGMSTVHEAVTAASLGMEVAGISCVANRAAGISPTPLSHAEVLAVMSAAAETMGRLLNAFLARLAD